MPGKRSSRWWRSFLLGSLFLLYFLPASAQLEPDSTTLWRIETRDENEFVGYIVGKDQERLKLQTESFGLITIKLADIYRSEKVLPDKIKSGEVWQDNLQATRYFWAPNGFGLKKGEGYYQNVWVLFNQASVGLTDNFSMGLGVIPTFFFGGGAFPVWITPKFSIPVKHEKLNLGAGILAGTILGEDSSVAGIAYGVSTFGSRDKNLTFGMGYGFADGDWARYPAITLSGMIRTGKRGYFLTENYFIGGKYEEVLLLSFGGRYIGKKVAFDYGGILPISSDIEIFLLIPWLGISVPFQ